MLLSWAVPKGPSWTPSVRRHNKAARKPSQRVVTVPPAPGEKAVSALQEPGLRDPGLRELVGRIPTGVSFTSLDKVLYPGQGLTKAALVAYYAITAAAQRAVRSGTGSSTLSTRAVR